jgi:hypothetical protein
MVENNKDEGCGRTLSKAWWANIYKASIENFGNPTVLAKGNLITVGIRANARPSISSCLA